jgi:hypothetical protein
MNGVEREGGKLQYSNAWHEQMEKMTRAGSGPVIRSVFDVVWRRPNKLCHVLVFPFSAPHDSFTDFWCFADVNSRLLSVLSSETCRLLKSGVIQSSHLPYTITMLTLLASLFMSVVLISTSGKPAIYTDLPYKFTLAAWNVTRPNANATGVPLVLGEKGLFFWQPLGSPTYLTYPGANDGASFQLTSVCDL